MLQIITTREELQRTINEAVRRAVEGVRLPQQQPSQSEQIKGIAGLARFLDCSQPTAQRIKNSGKIRYYQNGRTLIFRSNEVLEDMSNYKKRKSK